MARLLARAPEYDHVRLMPDSRAPLEFRRHQAAILGLLDRARPLLNSRDPGVWTTLSTFRADVLRGLTEYQAYKHRVIYDPIISGNSDKKRLAAELKADCIQLGVDYQAYTMTWRGMDTDGRWPEYRLAALSMMRQIRDALGREADMVRHLYR